MSVILKEAHERMLRNVKRKHLALHAFGVFLTSFLFFLSPLVTKLQNDLIRSSSFLGGTRWPPAVFGGLFKVRRSTSRMAERAFS